MCNYNYLKLKYTYKWGIKDKVLKAIVIAAKYVCVSVYPLEEGENCGRGRREMRRMRRWVNVSPRKDTRCALRELTRESRVLSMKHGTPENVRKKDGWNEEKLDREREKERRMDFSPLFFCLCSSKGTNLSTMRRYVAVVSTLSVLSYPNASTASERNSIAIEVPNT